MVTSLLTPVGDRGPAAAAAVGAKVDAAIVKALMETCNADELAHLLALMKTALGDAELTAALVVAWIEDVNEALVLRQQGRPS